MPQTVAHYLKKAWLATTLAITLATGMAQAQTPPRPQQTQRTQTQEVTYADGVTGIQTEFNKTVLGRNLLLFAQQYDVTFSTDATLQARGRKAEYNPNIANVALRPHLTPDEVSMTGAHEVRHAYQDKKLGMTALEGTLISPWQRWTLRRYLEGDAVAYGGFFGADRMEKGLRIGKGFGKEGAAANIAMAVRGELQFSRDGLTPAEFLKLGLEPGMAGLENYNDAHLAMVQKQVTEFEQDVRAAANGDKRKLQELTARLAATPSDAAFEAKMRQFGTLASDFLPLQNVSQQALMQDYPRLGTNVNGFGQKLDREMQSLTQRHNTALRQLQDVARKAGLTTPRPRA